MMIKPSENAALEALSNKHAQIMETVIETNKRLEQTKIDKEWLEGILYRNQEEARQIAVAMEFLKASHFEIKTM